MRASLLASAILIVCGFVADAQVQTNQSIVGYWQIKADTSTTNLLPITPINPEILYFEPNGKILGKIGGMSFTGGTYKDGGDRVMTIKLYCRPDTATFNYSISSNLLVLNASDGKHADYTNITAAVDAARNAAATNRHSVDDIIRVPSVEEMKRGAKNQP